MHRIKWKYNFITKENKKANVSSNDGKKHNKSFGKYYGFGLTNKYNSSENGLTFGHFKRKVDKFDIENISIESKLRLVFNSLASNLNTTLPGSINADNNTINTLISIGQKMEK